MEILVDNPAEITKLPFSGSLLSKIPKLSFFSMILMLILEAHQIKSLIQFSSAHKIIGLPCVEFDVCNISEIAVPLHLQVVEFYSHSR